MVKDINNDWGALGYEFYKAKMNDFKKGETVLCLCPGNDYELPWGWSNPFIYAKFDKVYAGIWAITDEGRFSIDRIFKVDKEFRFEVPQIGWSFISHFAMEVKEENGVIHFNYLNWNKNCKQSNFCISVKASSDFIHHTLASKPDIHVFKLKSKKSVATKKAKAVKPVKAPSTHIHEVNNQGTKIFGVWYNHKRPHELKKENSSFVVTWLDDCEDNISTSRINLFNSSGVSKQVKQVHDWLLEQGFYITNDQFRLPEKVVKILDENIPKVGEPKSNITGLNGCSCHPFANWKESTKAHNQKFEVGDQVINRCNKKVGFIAKNTLTGGFFTVKYGERPVDHELEHAAQLQILVPVKSPLNKNFKTVATKKIKPVKVTSVENETAVWPMEKGNFFYTSNSDRLHQFKSFEFDEDIEGEYDDIYKPLITINAVYVMDGQKSYFNHYNIKNGKLKHVSSLEEIIIVKEPIKVEIKFMIGTRWHVLWLNNGTNNDNILISGIESKSIAIEKAKKFGFQIVATKSIISVPVPSADQEPKAETKNETTSKRDKNSQKRDEMIKFRVTSEVKELIQELAKYDQCTVAELLKRSLKKYGLTSIIFNKPFDFSKLEIIQ